MITEIVVSGAFMILELFFLSEWIKRREKKREEESSQVAWWPFRKMMLDAIVRHADELLAIAEQYEREMGEALTMVRKAGQLTRDTKHMLSERVVTARARITESRNRFFNILQTVAPSLQPYAAQYCNEVLWFGDAVLKSLETAEVSLGEIADDGLPASEAVSHQLNGVSVSVTTTNMYRTFRFEGFKSNFTQSVWKKEALHYHEREGEFMPPNEYIKALETDKAVAELRRVPRTAPVKSFFADSDSA